MATPMACASSWTKDWTWAAAVTALDPEPAEPPGNSHLTHFLTASYNVGHFHRVVRIKEKSEMWSLSSETLQYKLIAERSRHASNIIMISDLWVDSDQRWVNSVVGMEWGEGYISLRWHCGGPWVMSRILAMPTWGVVWRGPLQGHSIWREQAAPRPGAGGVWIFTAIPLKVTCDPHAVKSRGSVISLHLLVRQQLGTWWNSLSLKHFVHVASGRPLLVLLPSWLLLFTLSCFFFIFLASQHRWTSGLCPWFPFFLPILTPVWWYYLALWL